MRLDGDRRNSHNKWPLLSPSVNAVKTVSAAQFKNRCLALVDEVSRTRQPLVVTRHGTPVAQIGPVVARDAAANRNPLKGSVLHEADLVAPIEGAWDALA
jgi:prevent-host-death family protein